MIKNTSNLFSKFLKEELLKRTQKNPRFSLRAFARHLDLDPSFISKIILGQRNPSRKVMEDIGKKLNIGAPELESLLEHCPPQRRERNPQKYHPIEIDYFHLLSEWQYFAILEVINLKSFKPTHQWIAHKLGISIKVAEQSVERLFRLGLLKNGPNGRWMSAHGNTTTIGSKQTNRALRILQRQMLEKSIIALENTPISLRDNSTLTLAIPIKKIEKAKKMICAFRRNFDKQMQADGDFDSVYHLVMAFYPVTTQTK